MSSGSCCAANSSRWRIAEPCIARWQTEAKDTANNVARFAAWMVQNRYLTDYQAMLLARGHADGFFLNEYKIVDRLGKGRMAGVYKAMHQLGQVVAIKVLPPSRASDPNFLGRFQREAKLALRLKHPNIVRSFQVGTAGNLHFIVMEYLEGETLEEVLKRRGKLPPTEAVRLVHQALQGLQHIHEQGLVHRDLKPSNLMLIYPPGVGHDSTLKATLKILDIGLGRVHVRRQLARHRHRSGAHGRRGAAGHAGLHGPRTGHRRPQRGHQGGHLQSRMRAVSRPGRATAVSGHEYHQSDDPPCDGDAEAA